MLEKLRTFLDKYAQYGVVLFSVFLMIVLLTTKCNAQTKEEVYDYLVQIECKYPDIVLVQARHETGNFKSKGARVRKNLFGLWNHDKQEYYTFSCWQESCNEYLCMVQYKYQGGDYYKFLEEIGYATDPIYIQKLKRY